jgi:hypothetical protein
MSGYVNHGDDKVSSHNRAVLVLKGLDEIPDFRLSLNIMSRTEQP